MAIPSIKVIQQDQTPATLHYREGIYRQPVTLLTVFNPRCLELDPNNVTTYEEISPYVRSAKNLTWLLVGLSFGILTNLIGQPSIWPYAIVIFTFALASTIFSSHANARHRLYQMTMKDGSRLFVVIEVEHLSSMARQFPNARQEIRQDLYSKDLNSQEELHVEQIRYGLVTASASGSLILLSNNLLHDNSYRDDLASMLTLGVLFILMGLVMVSLGKIAKVERLKRENQQKR